MILLVCCFCFVVVVVYLIYNPLASVTITGPWLQETPSAKSHSWPMMMWGLMSSDVGLTC